MPTDLKPSEVVEAIESGFSPLECRVELSGQRLGFAVFDTDGYVVLPLSSWNVRWARKPASLRARIVTLRKRVELEGYALDPWKVLA
jgi:hypothetical protein